MVSAQPRYCLRLTVLILVSHLICVRLSAQYFFTGEVKGLHGDKLQNVSVIVQSTGFTYRTGLNGNFEIISRRTEDSLIFLFDGYERYTAAIHSTDFLQVTLKLNTALAFSKNDHLLSESKGGDITYQGYGNGLSYSTVRRFLDMGYTVPPEAVKIEELLNYFNSWYEDPENQDPFHCSSQLFSCPWNASHRLLCLNVCARKADISQAPPTSLVLLVDASGSMDMPNKMPLVKAGARLLVKNLRDIDTISIIAYGEKGVVLYAAPGSHKEEIIRAIEGLQADGPSPGEAGIRLAYHVAQRQFIQDGNNKIILVTDGDITDGADAGKQLASFVTSQTEAGIHLSCLGVGMDTSRDSELAELAYLGHGSFACAGELQGIEKELTAELAPSLCTVAENVSLTASFDTTLVLESRLLGFENKGGHAGDTTFRLQGSRVGSGHAILALFELVPKKDTLGIETVAEVRIDYCLPGQHTTLTMNYSCPNKPISFDRAEGSLKRAACIALFGMKLKASAYTTDIPWADIEKITRKNFSGNNAIDREYLMAVNKARKVYEKK